MSISSKKTFKKMVFFSKAWFAALRDGNRPLWEAWFVFGAALVGVIVFSSWLSLSYPSLSMPFYYIILFLQIFWWIAVWNCAPNASPIFYYISRGLVVMAVLGTLGNFLSEVF